MGYYMRFFDTSAEALDIDALAAALTAIDPAYRLDVPPGASIPQADVYHGEELYGELEINEPGGGLFEEEIDEMRESLEGSRSRNRPRVEEVLRAARRIVAVRVLWQGRETEPTMARLDPLWEWLFANRGGLLHADGEGYYDAGGRILKDR